MYTVYSVCCKGGDQYVKVRWKSKLKQLGEGVKICNLCHLTSISYVWKWGIVSVCDYFFV